MPAPTKRPRADDNVTDEPSVSGEAALTKENLVWSSFIKAHHQRIRDSVKADHGGDAEAAWRAVLQDQVALAQYATSMHHLATKYWDAAPPTVVMTNDESVASEGDARDPSSSLATASATKFRYDDRIEYALLCMQEYFLGPVAGAGGGGDGKMTFLPLVVTAPLKQAKREYYQAQNAPMPEAAQVEWMRTWLQQKCTSTTAALRATLSAFEALYTAGGAGGAAPPLNTVVPPAVAPSLRVLDVGSCYAPFEGKSLTMWHRNGNGSNSTSTVAHHHHTCDDADKEASVPSCNTICHSSSGLSPMAFPLDVVSVDLAPYADSTVWPCDWLSVSVRTRKGEHLLHPKDDDDAAAAKDLLCFDNGHEGEPSAPTASSPPPPVSYCGRPHVLGIYEGSFDVITFSLVLSYMPTPQMRFEACRKAHAVLRDHGLLVVVSTRTQGPRQASWVDEWITAIESIGFVRVHKNIRCRLIGLTFQKVSPNSTAEGEEERWNRMAAKMVITADTI